MKIGIDIDGVLIDTEQWQLDYASKFYYDNYKMKIVNPKGYETYEIFDCNQQRDDDFWTKYFFYYSIKADVRKFASEVIKKLKHEGNDIYIITARGSFLSNSSSARLYEINKKVVKRWLKKNSIKYDKLIFSPEDKLDICIKENIDLMIEDKADNINKISTKIPVICFNAGHNESCSGNNITRCYSWYDIYVKINKYNKN